MNVRFPPAVLAGVIAGVVLVLFGAVASQILFVLLGVLIALVVLAGFAIKNTAAQANDSYDELSPDSRILIRPLNKIYNEMAEAAEGKSETISPYIAQEALTESKRLLDQSTAALLLRDRLKRESRGRYDAEKSIGDLKARMDSALGDDEKVSLQSAMDARTKEIGHYDLLKDGIAKIESSVKQAEVAMAEMRARLITSNSVGVAEQGSDPLRETVGRMQALSASLTEAQEMLQR